MYHTSSRCRGFTLVEAAVAVCIVAISATAVAPGLRALLERKRLEGVAAQLASELQTVRTEAVARNEPLRVSFHADPGGSCVAIHTGPKAACSCSGGAPALCSGDARQLRTIYLPAEHGIAVSATAASILFDPEHGTSTPTGTVRVVGARGAVHHVVNVLGRVRSCSPGGNVPGYRLC